MGGHRRSSADVRRDDEFFDRSPSLTSGRSPSPLLLGKAAAKTPTTRGHVAAVRCVCAPFTAVFSMKCARADTRDDDEKPSHVKATATTEDAGERKKANRRPRLEELLLMDASSSRRERKTAAEATASPGCRTERAIVVFGVADSAHRVSCTVNEEEQMPLSLSKSRRAVVASVERAAAIVPVKMDVDVTMSPAAGGSAALSPAVPIFASLRHRALLQALRMDMRPGKGQYWKLAAGRSCAAGAKAELFYQRPIPLGRRCRVQHLEESPYM